VGATKDKLAAVLDQLQELGIENILALRGDPPQGDPSFVPVANGFRYASDLIAFAKERQFFSIAAAAYPEGHMECPDLELDMDYLKQKVDQGVDLLITQLFFDNSFFYTFRDKIRSKGIHCPVTIGVMPVLNAAQMKRMTALCGATIPQSLAGIMKKYGGQPAEMEKAGIEFVCQQIEDLLAHEVDGIHLCTMNKAEQTKTIVQNLRGLLV
jgi:methylenetetrahydrofolate reductase (NADPH)